MGDRLPAVMPRIAVIALVALGATTTLTYAAGRKLAATPAPKRTAAKPQLATIVVPDVTKEAYVFAKGQLEDAGFAWKVAGPVHGLASNTVVSQSPPAGTKLLDTGAPLVTLTLSLNRGYNQSGEPEDASPYMPTAMHLAGVPAKPAAPAPKPKTSPKPAAPAKAPAYPQMRPVAFVVPGARKEPLDEMPLPDRAKALGTWLTAHPRPTGAAQNYWLYQNEWVVAGARMGWWRGAEALQTLVAVDVRTVALWGVGTKSEALARAALAEVEAKAKK